jgi:hypothetical protein
MYSSTPPAACSKSPMLASTNQRAARSSTPSNAGATAGALFWGGRQRIQSQLSAARGTYAVKCVASAHNIWHVAGGSTLRQLTRCIYLYECTRGTASAHANRYLSLHARSQPRRGDVSSQVPRGDELHHRCFSRWGMPAVARDERHVAMPALRRVAKQVAGVHLMRCRRLLEV